MMRRLIRFILALLLAVTAPRTVTAADLQPRTAAGFDRYVHATEAQMRRRAAFLWVDAPGGTARQRARTALAGGVLLIEAIDRDDTGISREVPDGLIHHWIGTVFVPGATIEPALALLQDYDRHATVYAPAVSRAKLLSRTGNVFRMHLQFTMTRIITVVVNTDNEAVFTRDAPDRAHSVIHSTRVAQVEDAGTPGEHEAPHRMWSLWFMVADTHARHYKCT
jgi:hypothetical protein